MNILKKLTVRGDIFAEYAYLSFEFDFKSLDYSAENQYIFRLPTGSCISNIIISTSRGDDSKAEIIQPKIVAASHLCGMKNLKDAAILTRLSDDTYTLKIKTPNKHCRLVSEVYAPLEIFGCVQKISIPQASPTAQTAIEADIDILVRGAAINEVFSDSHNIQCREASRGISVGLNEASVSGNLNIQISSRPCVNSAVATTDGLNGEMLCRLFPSERFLSETGFGDKIKQAEVISGRSKGTIIKYPERIGDSLDVIFEFRGSSPETEFRIRCGDVCETVKLEKSRIYNNFAPIRLLYAQRLCADLVQKLNDCAPDEVRSIKRKIERIGIKYSALNTETAFVADLGNNEYGLIRTHTSKDKNTTRLYDSHTDILGVTAAPELLGVLAHTLIRLMHGDGAICTDDEYSTDGRKLQTLLAVLALIASDMIDPNGEFVRSAKAYIGGSKICGMSFTSNSGTAIVMLKSFIMSNPDITVGSPEFYSAIKQLCNANA